MEYRQYAPPPALREYVRYFWSFDSRQGSDVTLIIKSFADRFPRLIFQNLDGFDPIRNTEGNSLPGCYFSGIDTRCTHATMKGSFSHFGVSFYPHALNIFFGIDANELTNEMPPIEWLSHHNVHERLSIAASHRERVLIVTHYLYARLDAVRKQQDGLINYIIHSDDIHAHTDIFAVQKKYKISERQLERKFKSAVGVTPKNYQRITRFEKSLNLLENAGYAQLTAIAYDLDYSDQSHFIKEFSAFSGMTPYAFIKNRNVGGESSSFLFQASDG